MVECLNNDPTWCLDDYMGHLPRIGSNDNNTWFGQAGCGLIVLEEGTYDEANAAVEAHRTAVRAQNPVPPQE